MDAAMDELLDRKTASEGELKEAFCVFDGNEDGFVCAVELWSVMRRLGFKEGRRYEDCMRMSHIFDEDRDGRISYLEFRRMMEGCEDFLVQIDGMFMP
uniref:EF-hand domain-containing protein n=1 Tax=Oryza brachyantha TaxID=4533 RepID=J3MJH9_ORYBR